MYVNWDDVIRKRMKTPQIAIDKVRHGYKFGKIYWNKNDTLEKKLLILHFEYKIAKIPTISTTWSFIALIYCLFGSIKWTQLWDYLWW